MDNAKMTGLGPTIAEMAERARCFIENEGPWNNGGKQECLARFGLAMTHDELAASIGLAYQKINDAGFVLVPRGWREDVMKALEKKNDRI
jgi:hypothetical protein